MRVPAVLLFAALSLTAAASEPPDPLVAEALEKKVYVLAEFVSRTCPACRDMGPVVEAALARRRNVVRRVHDADRELELSKKYQVRCVPVYVIVDPQGKVRFNDVGVRTEEEFDGILQEAGVPRR